MSEIIIKRMELPEDPSYCESIFREDLFLCNSSLPRQRVRACASLLARHVGPQGGRLRHVVLSPLAAAVVVQVNSVIYFRLVNDHRLGRLVDLEILSEFKIMVDRLQNRNQSFKRSYVEAKSITIWPS